MSKTIPHPSATGEEQEARNRLVEQHLYLVNFLANRFRGRRFAGLDLDDLIQEGYIGLMRAAELYDPEKINPDTGRPYRFSAYASRTILGVIFNALARKGRSIQVPQYIWVDLIHLERAQSECWLRLQREPSLDELAEAMQRTPAQVMRLLEIREVQSLDAPLFSSYDDDATSLADQLEAPDLTLQRERRTEIADLLQYLSREERSVIECRYQLGHEAGGERSEDIPLTYVEVARRLQMTREHTQTVEKRALMKMHYWAERPTWREQARHVSGER